MLLIMDFLENGDLLKHERKAGELVLEGSLYQVANVILYHIWNQINHCSSAQITDIK